MTRSPASPPSSHPPGSPQRNAPAAARTEANSPLVIARDALRQLASQRLPPTPDNYRDIYHQIAGTAADDAFPTRALRAIAGVLPRSTPEAVQIAHRFEEAVNSGQWQALRQALLTICEARNGPPLAWGPLLRELLAHVEQAGEGAARAQRLGNLHQALAAAAGSEPEQLFIRLQGLLRNWMQTADGGEPAVQPANGRLDLPSALTELMARLLRRGVAPTVAHDPALAAEVGALADAAPTLRDPAGLDAYTQRLDALNARLSWHGEDQHAIRQALLSLLRLLVDNIRELVLDDNWLHGQLSVLAEAFAGELDIRVLDEVERRLRDVIDKQSHLKRQLSDAQQRLKTMLAGFIDRLAAFSNTTGEFHDVLEDCATRIGAAKDIAELSDVVEEMMRETRNTQESARRSGEELAELREQVESANQHILRLQRELDETSELVRHDPLTGALNRKGLDETLAREIARARRHGQQLSLALLDVDNFKQLNDSFGHRIGDDALRHLAGVIRETLRPQDSLARYGGEEFLIVLPDTEPDQAVSVVVRLQRELTRRFFLADSQKLLITFSAGVTRLNGDEEPIVAIDRADKAMYAAKRAGKNRVLTAA